MKQMLPHVGFIFKRNIRDKKNIYYIIMMGLCSLVILCTISFVSLYYYNLNRQYDKNIAFKTLFVSPSDTELQEYATDSQKTYNYDIDKIKNINHVSIAYSSKDETNILNNPIIDGKTGDALYLMYGTEEILPNIIKGTKFSYDNENVMICPNRIYPSEEIEFEDIGKDTINGLNILNKTIKGTYDVRKYNSKTEKTETIRQQDVEFKVVGIYDVDDSYFGINQCFIPGKQLEKISKDVFPKKDFSVISSLIVIVDKKSNVDYVKKELEGLGYVVSYRMYVPKDYLNKANVIFLAIIVLSIIAITIISTLYTKKKILNNSHILKLSKAIGYNNEKIKAFYAFDNLVCCFINCIVITVIFIIINAIVYLRFTTLLNNVGIYYRCPILELIMSIIVIAFISSFSNIYCVNRYLKKMKFSNGEI